MDIISLIGLVLFCIVLHFVTKGRNFDDKI